MISKVLLVLILSFVSFNALAFREVRNGGAGIKVDGRFLTFQSAKIPVTARPEKPMDIPGLQYLINRISTLPIDNTMKGKLILNIWATSTRKYFRVSNSQVSLEERNKIINEYSNLMNIPADDIAIFAITSTEANATLLLPEFYQLKETEQAAILLHEAMWIWKPNATYNSVVAVEQAAQAFFEDRSHENYYNFVYQLGRMANSPRFAIAAALGYDVSENRMGPLATLKNRVPLRSLIGASFIKGLLTKVDQPLEKSKLVEYAAAAIGAATDNSLLFPQNTFYSALLDFLQMGGFISLSAYIPLEESTIMANEGMLLRNQVFLSHDEISDYIKELYIDLSIPATMDPLRYRLINYEGKVLGSVIFF